MRRIATPLTALLLGLVALPARSLPPELHVDPDRCFLAGSIRVWGWVQPDADKPQELVLKFFPPGGGAPIEESLRTEPDGDYEFIFRDTGRVGTWRVEAFKGGKSAGRSSFEVTAHLFMRELADALEQIATGKTKTLLQEFQQAVERYPELEGESPAPSETREEEFPDFPDRDELLAKSRELQGQFDELARITEDFRAKAEQFEQALRSWALGISGSARGPGGPAIRFAALGSSAPIRPQLASTGWIDTISPRVQQAFRALADVGEGYRVTASELDESTLDAFSRYEEARQEAERCAYWQGWADTFDLLGNALGYFKENAADLLTQIGANAVTNLLEPPLSTFFSATASVVGVIVGGSIVSGPGTLLFAGAAALSVASAIAYVTVQGIVGAYCRVWDGDIEGTYVSALYHDDNQFFYSSYILGGKMRISYPRKQVGGAPVQLQGRFTGAADRFECDEDMRMAFGAGLPTDLGYTRCKIPWIGGSTFDLRLAGNALDDRLRVRLEGVLEDFDLKAAFVYFIGGPMTAWGPFTLPAIEKGDFVWPYQNAEWFFTRVTYLSQKPTVDLMFQGVGASTVVQGDFSRQFYFPETPDRFAVSVALEMKFELKARGPTGP